MKAEFWKGRKVLLTGHTGFKGSWLSLLLQELGADLYGISLPPEEESLFNVANIESAYRKSFYLDIRELNDLSRKIQDISPEIVIHMAAQPLVLESLKDPLSTFLTNILGTANVLEAVRNLNIKPLSVLAVTSDKCYENFDTKRYFVESDKLGGEDPYSASKASSEIIVRSYYKSYLEEMQVGVATARAGNVIGGGDFARDRLIPDAFRAHRDKKPMIVRNFDAIRPWQHVLDPLIGYLKLAARLSISPSVFSGAWNFGPSPDQHKEVSFVLRKFNESMALETLNQEKNKVEMGILKLDSTKSIENLEWKSSISLNSTVELSIDWYQAYLDGQNMTAFTKNQILKILGYIRDN